jgi:hypothetical protein
VGSNPTCSTPGGLVTTANTPLLQGGDMGSIPITSTKGLGSSVPMGVVSSRLVKSPSNTHMGQ